MKKVKLLSLMVLAFLFHSCGNDDEILTNKDENSVKVKRVWVSYGSSHKNKAKAENGNGNGNEDGEYALSFSDEASFQKFKQELAVLSDEEKMEKIHQYGIKNLHVVSNLADDELEEIGKKAKTIEEFKTLYGQYKNKYKGLLIENNIDSTDLSLYVPDEENVESYIGNNSGIYVVNNEIKVANLKNELSESVRQSSFAFMNPNNGQGVVNYDVFKPKKNKKVYFRAFLVGRSLKITMKVRKKMWYGWKNDPHRHFYFDTYLTPNFNHLHYLSGHEVVQRLPRYTFNRNVRNGVNIVLGVINFGNSVSGEIHTWTDMTSEHGADGKELTEMLDGWFMTTKCLKEKARVVKIDWSI